MVMRIGSGMRRPCGHLLPTQAPGAARLRLTLVHTPAAWAARRRLALVYAPAAGLVRQTLAGGGRRGWSPNSRTGGGAAAAGVAPRTGGLGGASAVGVETPRTDGGRRSCGWPNSTHRRPGRFGCRWPMLHAHGSEGGSAAAGVARRTGGLGGTTAGNEMQRTDRGFTMNRSRSPSPRDVANAQPLPSDGEDDDMHAQNVRPGTVIDLSMDSDGEHVTAAAMKPSQINLMSSSESDGMPF